MARCLDENGEDASLLDKKLKELMAESISRKQKEGRKRSRVEKELAEEDKHITDSFEAINIHKCPSSSHNILLGWVQMILDQFSL